MKAVAAAVVVGVLVVLGVGSPAGATSAKDKKAYKAFVVHLHAVQAGALAFRKTATGPDPSDAALRAPCTSWAEAVAAAQATKRPKQVKASVWSHVTRAYGHFKAAAAFCLAAAPGTSNFFDAAHEYRAGSDEIAKVQAALHI